MLRDLHLSLVGGSDIYAVLVCGNDPYSPPAAAVFQRDLIGFKSVLTDSRIVGVRWAFIVSNIIIIFFFHFAYYKCSGCAPRHVQSSNNLIEASDKFKSLLETHWFRGGSRIFEGGGGGGGGGR